MGEQERGRATTTPPLPQADGLNYFFKGGGAIHGHFLALFGIALFWALSTAGRYYFVSWIGERVAKVDLERVVFNILDARDDLGWGPNDTFRFPLHGGTGAIWAKLAGRLPPPQSEGLAAKQLRRPGPIARASFSFVRPPITVKAACGQAEQRWQAVPARGGRRAGLTGGV